MSRKKMENMMEKKKNLEKACFGAGCFWHVEHEFSKINGVVKTAVGFTGGTAKNPSYKDVCKGRTGHVEVCLVEFDPGLVSYHELLQVFWNIHDPTQLNRQGVDVGTQYRSAIFYYDEKQRKLAIKSKEKEQKKYKQAIATQIVQAAEFYMAEEYHQKYLENNKLAVCGLR